MAVNTTNNRLEKYVGEVASDKLIELIKANLAGMASDADIDEALANLFLETKGGTGRYIKELRQTNGKIHAAEASVLNTAVDGSIDPVSSGELFRLHKDSMLGIGKLSSDGAKNKLEISQESGIKNNASLSITGSSMTISGTGAYARCSFPITLKAGDYMFSCNCTANNSSTARIKFNTLADGSGTELSEDLIISNTGERATLLQLANDTNFFVIYYANYGDTTPSGISLTIADSMICYQIEHAASADYAEYAPANRLLYEQIKSLQAILTPVSQAEYEAMTDKELPLYFIYD